MVGTQPIFRMSIIQILKRLSVWSNADEFIEINELTPEFLLSQPAFDIAVLCTDSGENALVDQLSRISRVATSNVVLFSEVFGKRHQHLLDSQRIDLCLPYSVPCSVAEHYISEVCAPNRTPVASSPAVGQIALKDRTLVTRFLPDLADLSHSEQMVLMHLRDGISNQAIADRMNLQPNTVKVYLYRACRKAGFINRTQAARTTHDMLSSGLLVQDLQASA